MKAIRILGAALLASASISTAIAAGHDGPEITGEGSCSYTQENMFAGPYSVCQEPVGPESCAALGETADNADAVHSATEACATEGLVGTCDLGATKLHYFDGDADGLEIGCGFQGGDWIPAG